MRRKAILRWGAALICAVLLCACAAPVVSPAPSAAAPEPTVPPVPGERLSFEAKYYRTDGFVEGIAYPQVTTIQSPQEAQAYVDANKEVYSLNPNRAEIFTKALLGFDDAYFQDHVIIVVMLEEPSGSIRHLVTAVVQTDDRTRVLIRRDVPEPQTADMAQWHILLELSREGYQGNKAAASTYD